MTPQEAQHCSKSGSDKDPFIPIKASSSLESNLLRAPTINSLANVQHTVSLLDFRRYLPAPSTSTESNPKNSLATNIILRTILRKETQTFGVLNSSVGTGAILYKHMFVSPFGIKHLQTFAPLNAAKGSKLAGNIQNKMKKGSTSNKTAEDCVCPEIPMKKSKKQDTLICGGLENEEKDKKKKSKWKQKMCLADVAVKVKRTRTKVCLPTIKVSKRKSNMPECPKPEKKKVPKATVCPPDLTDEGKTKKKECVKVTEVKVRKLTKVCLPKLTYGEEVIVKAEKKVCIPKVKQIPSKHTIICAESKKKKNVFNESK